MKIAVVGSRSFNDYEKLKLVLHRYRTPGHIIVSGGAKGADTLAERFADEFGLEKKIFLPNWKLYPRIAGFIRNELIADYADMCVAFWDGKSKGTKHTIGLFNKRNKTAIVIINNSLYLE